MMGIEYLYGGAVNLETSDFEGEILSEGKKKGHEHQEKKAVFRRVLYTMKNRELSRKIIE
jgi:hypothetical protein